MALELLADEVVEAPPEPSVKQEFTRVGSNELIQMWVWLYPRLREHYPKATERQIRTWLGQCASDNDCFFICNGLDAVALVQIVRDPMEEPFIKERFVLARGEVEPAEALYSEISRWGYRNGVGRIWHNLFSDVQLMMARRKMVVSSGKAETMRIPTAFLLSMDDE